MTKTTLKVLILLILAVIWTQDIAAMKTSIKDLPLKYRKWLEEDVVYIITPREKEVFLQLETDRDRSLFIEAFWKHRDPTLGSPENETRNEHYRRIKYANSRFGIGTPLPGWKTDRGRIYIILGEPHSIDSYSSLREIRDTEIWFYQDMAKYGLPSAFNVVFFRKGMADDYRLYSPSNDGPYSLFIQTPQIDPANYIAAYEMLKNINTTIAEVSISLIPGDLSLISGRPSLSSEVLIQNIALKPLKEVDDIYAEKLLKYKSLVEVEYSTNFIDSDYLIQTIQDRTGRFYVHYLISLKRLSVGEYRGNYYANFIVSGQITDTDNRVIFQFDKEYSQDFKEEKIRMMQTIPFQINDLFPLIPGTYKFTLILKNTVSKEFSSFETDLIIPGQITSPVSGALLLNYQAREMKDSAEIMRPFQVDDRLLFCEPSSTFLPTDQLIIFFQLLGADDLLTRSGTIEFSLIKGEGESVKVISRPIRDYRDPVNIIEKLPLLDFTPDNYTIEVSVLGSDSNKILSQTKRFSISPVSYIPRPFVKAKAFSIGKNAVNDYRIGLQYLNKGEYQKARIELEKALHKIPEQMVFAINLAKTYFMLKEYNQVLDTLTPFLERDDVRYEVHFYMGRAALAISEYDKAVQLFREAILRFGTNTNLLNLLGESYYRLNDHTEAKKAWDRSLELNPDQPRIKEKINTLNEKK